MLTRAKRFYQVAGIGILISAAMMTGCSPEKKSVPNTAASASATIPEKPLEPAIPIDPAVITFNGITGTAQTYLLESDGDIRAGRQHMHMYANMVLTYRVDHRNTKGETTFSILPAYFYSEAGEPADRQVLSSADPDLRREVFQALMKGFQLKANLRNGILGKLHSDDANIRHVLANLSSQPGGGLAKAFHLPTTPIRIAAKEGATQNVTLSNGFYTQMKVVKLTPHQVIISFTGQREDEQATAEEKQDQPGFFNEYYTSILTLNRQTGWLERMVLLTRHIERLRGRPVELIEKEVMYPQNAFRPDYLSIPKHWDPLPQSTRYTYQPPVASADSMQAVFPSNYGVLTSADDGRYQLHYFAPSAYLGQLKFRAVENPDSQDAIASYFVRTPRRAGLDGMISLWLRQAAWTDDFTERHGRIATMKATVDYYPYTLSKHPLPVNPQQPTDLQLETVSATLSPVSGHAKTFQLTLYGADNRHFIWQGIPELKGTTVTSLPVSDVHAKWLSAHDQQMLASAERRQTYQITFGAHQTLPKTLTLTEKVIATAPQFSKQVTFTDAAEQIMDASVPPLYRPETRPSGLTRINQHQLRLTLSGPQWHDCQVMTDTPEENQHKLVWQPVATSFDSVGFPAPYYQILTTDDHKRQYFYDRKVAVTLQCPGGITRQKIALKATQRPWLVDTTQLPGFDKNLSLAAFRARYQFVSAEGQWLDIYGYTNKNALELHPAKTVGDAVIDHQYLKLNGRVATAYLITVSGKPTTQRWVATLPALQP